MKLFLTLCALVCPPAHSEATNPTLNGELRAAVRAGSLTDTQQLLARGASITTTDDRGASLVHLAALQGRTGVLNFLLRQFSDSTALSLRDDRGQTPLHYAAQGCQAGTAEQLATRIQKGARTSGNPMSFTDHYNRTPLHIAVSGDCGDVIEVWARSQVPLHWSSRDLYGWTPRELLGRSGLAQRAWATQLLAPPPAENPALANLRSAR